MIDTPAISDRNVRGDFVVVSWGEKAGTDFRGTLVRKAGLLECVRNKRWEVIEIGPNGTVVSGVNGSPLDLGILHNAGYGTFRRLYESGRKKFNTDYSFPKV